MSDLGRILPDVTFEKHEALVQRLEDQFITTSDLVSVDAVDISRRVNVPVPVIKELADEVASQLHAQLSSGLLPGVNHDEPPAIISFLDDALDIAVGGGVRPGYVTEVVGPSGAGKTQFLLMTLLTAQLRAPCGLGRPTVYLSTEHALPTQRLEGMLQANSRLRDANPKPSLSRIITLHAPDLETQEHVIEFQLPVAVERHNIGLVVIDSIAANYRAEDVRNSKAEGRGGNLQARLMSNRSAELIRLGDILRGLARRHHCAVLVANQVADRLDPVSMAMEMAAVKTPTSSPAGPPSSMDSSQSGQRMNGEMGLPSNVMSLDHQQRWFTGWGDQRPAVNMNQSREGPSLKTPTLGMVWTSQIACRISLHKQSDWVRGSNTSLAIDQTSAAQEAAGLGDADWSRRRWRRRIRLAFAPWAESCSEDDNGTEYEIWAGGLRSVSPTLSSR